MQGRMQDVTTGLETEKAILVGLDWPGNGGWSIEDSLAELRLLAESAGAEVIRTEVQHRDHPDPAYFIGAGKAREIAGLCGDTGAGLVVFDDQLTPAQVHHLEEILPCKVIDRTGLILDIFAQRARTREGKIQVELAQLRYILPRLSGRGTELSRLGGGIGTRGPGETKLEADRRRIRGRISELDREIDQVQAQREIQRAPRRRNEVPLAALVGYTNSGKSTLFNRLTRAGVTAEDKLFATLDPTLRRLNLPGGREIVLADTVGFIRKLPHELIAAFRGTLEETRHADVLIHVADIANENLAEQCASVNQVLGELEVLDKPILMAFNKVDRAPAPALVQRLRREFPDCVMISARHGEGVDELLQALESRISRDLSLRLLVPYADAGVVNEIRNVGTVQGEEYLADGIMLRVVMHRPIIGRFQRFVVEGTPEC